MSNSAHNLIALVDCNNFFVSCERLFRPELAMRPVVVLSSNDGCVISRSEEAKQLGIPMGEPFFRVRDACAKHGVAVFSSNFDLYRDLSRRVMYTLRRYADEVEVYSVDEAFLHLGAGTAARARELSDTLRAAVWRDTGIPVSVGVAPTKTLAKAASHFAKEAARGRTPAFFSNDDTRVRGVCVLDTVPRRTAALRELPIAEVWGIGFRLAPMLVARGITTAYDLAVQDDRWIRARMSVRVLRTVHELRGIPCFEVGEEAELRKSLLHSQSFGVRVTERMDLRSAVAHHARKVAEILRAERACAGEVSVFVRSSRHGARPHVAFDSDTLPVPTSDTFVLVRVALAILERIYRPGVSYAKAGVLVRTIIPEGALPEHTLFGESTVVSAPLMRALDSLRRRMGDVVRLGAEGGHGAWRARYELLSPRYTSKWEELPRVMISI